MVAESIAGSGPQTGYKAGLGVSQGCAGKWAVTYARGPGCAAVRRGVGVGVQWSEPRLGLEATELDAVGWWLCWTNIGRELLCAYTL